VHPVPKPNVMGLTEFALRYGISKTYARRLSERRDFPIGQKLAMGIVWDARDIETWIRKHPRPPAQSSSFDT
jgi:predicted DNA-binding transcriptional regulator AlpA